MKKQYFFSCCLLLVLLGAGLMKGYAQPSSEKAPPDPTEINKLRLAIEQTPDDLDLHEKYLKATGFSKRGASEEEFIRQYEKWIIKFPKSAAIRYALGHAFVSKESPKAKPYLLKAVEIDPKFHKAWSDLWTDGERWGDFKVSNGYLKKAVEAAPDNAEYSFYYASSFSKTDLAKYRSMSLDVAKRFPATERGAQSLYWLASRGQYKPEERVALYEQLRKEFSPDKFMWSSGGMGQYFDLLLEIEADKALELAKSMKDLTTKENENKTWTNQMIVAQNIIQARSLLSAGKPKEASDILAKTTVSRYSDAKVVVLLMKAEAAAAAGNTKSAYDSIIVSFAKEPTDKMKEVLVKYGSKLDKNASDIDADVWKIRDASAKPATPFTFAQYLKPGEVSLSDYRGKVVLITYWFPGCGPCRGEFPHFQDVVNKFKEKDLVYLGLNISLEQDEYVVPFMKSSGYSFIPLRVDPKWNKGNLDNRNAAPVNFLIDQEGRIVFSNFRTDESNERTLELMISSLLKDKKGF